MTESNADPTSEARISARAYELWEAEGRPEGRDKEHWFRARDEVARSDAEARHDDRSSQSSLGRDPEYVRPAGRKRMDMPPSTWSKTDEELDESFPASDPPGNY